MSAQGRWREKQRARGLCRDCHRPSTPYACCLRCRRLKAARDKARREG